MLLELWNIFPLCTELYNMVCSESGVYTDIEISSVLLPKSARESLQAALESGLVGLYASVTCLIVCFNFLIENEMQI